MVLSSTRGLLAAVLSMPAEGQGLQQGDQLGVTMTIRAKEDGARTRVIAEVRIWILGRRNTSGIC